MRDLLEAAAAEFAAAPFDPARWDAALEGLALAAGGWVGQLAAAASVSQGYVLNICPRLPLDSLAELETWGLDPIRQPRTQVMAAPPMRVYGDEEFLAPEARGKSAFYAFMDQLDASHACIAKIDEIEGVKLVAASVRSRRSGYADAADKAAFAALLPHVRAAARLQLLLEDQGAKLAMGMMGAVGHAALVCSGSGKVLAATPSAEAVLANGAFVTLDRGRLASTDDASDKALATAISRAAAPATLEWPAAGRVKLHDAGRRRFITADVAPVPPDQAAFRIQAAVLILFDLRSPSQSVFERLVRLYGLTAAEAEVAFAIAEGCTLRDLAEQRGVRIVTLRSQLASIFAKTGTGRQAELVALILREQTKPENVAQQFVSCR